MNIVSILLILTMTLTGSIASLFLKKASDLDGLTNMLKDKNIYIGGFLYLLSALINIILLKKLPYSIVLPLTSITYIWTMILSKLILKESITNQKYVGVGLILIGAILIAL